MLKKIIPLAAIALLSIAAFNTQAYACNGKSHGQEKCKCEKCAEMKGDCPKCAEAKKYMEEHKGKKPCHGAPKSDHNDQSRYND